MAKMSLGSYVFPHNPSKMSILKAKRITASVETYSSVAFFSWGTTVKGIKLKLQWPFMAASTFASIDALCMADVELVLNPQDGSGKTYTTEILSFDGEYHVGLAVAANSYRKNVEMELLIKAKV